MAMPFKPAKKPPMPGKKPPMPGKKMPKGPMKKGSC